MRACWLKWVGRDWSISADYIWLNYSGANSLNNVAAVQAHSRLPKIDINEQSACICKMRGLMSDALAGNESKSSNVINL